MPDTDPMLHPATTARAQEIQRVEELAAERDRLWTSLGEETARASALEVERDALRRDAFKKGWCVALGYVRREGLAFFEHSEGSLAECLKAEAAPSTTPTTEG